MTILPEMFDLVPFSKKRMFVLIWLRDEKMNPDKKAISESKTPNLNVAKKKVCKSTPVDLRSKFM